MFNNKKKEASLSSKKGMNPANSSRSLNTLVKGTTVEGTIKSDSDIRIDGIIKGSLHCKAKVIIGPTGFIEGEVRCANAVIEGQFEGTLQVTELLNVRETAKVSGDVRTNKLIVQSGAVFNVSCLMGASSNNNNGSFDSTKSNKSVGKAKEKVGYQQATS